MPLLNGCCSGRNHSVISAKICPGTRLCALSDSLCRTAQDAEAAIDRAERGQNYPTAWSVIWEAFGLVFIAELGDRTQFATIFLAAAPGFTFAGLLAGSLLGHAVVTALAVGAGQWIGKRVNEALLYRLSGGLFLVFGLVSLKQALG